MRVAIDDFGTGYSSLAYLKGLPADVVKIDRRFIGGLPDDTADVTIVSTVIELAHRLGLRTVAEGVETQKQASILRLLGCESLQGYHICKPVDADTVTRYARAATYPPLKQSDAFTSAICTKDGSASEPSRACCETARFPLHESNPHLDAVLARES